MWLAMKLFESATCNVLGTEQTLRLTQLEIGCLGVCYVFKTKRQAEKYAGRGNAMKVTTVKPTAKTRKGE